MEEKTYEFSFRIPRRVLNDLAVVSERTGISKEVLIKRGLQVLMDKDKGNSLIAAVEEAERLTRG